MSTVTHLTTQTNYTFSNSNNVTFGVNGSTVTASASYPAQTAFQFSNANGVTFGTNGSTVTASVETNYQAPGAYLTTAMASNRETDFVQATAAFAGTNASGTIASGGISVSVNAGGAGDGYNIVGVNGNTVGSNVTVQFSNSNNVTFGLNGSTITASASYVNDLTSGRAGVGETVTTTAGTDLKLTVDTNGVNIAHPAWLTTAQPVGAYLTTAAQSDHSHGNPTLALTNLTGTTASASNGFTLSLSAANPGGGAGATLSHYKPDWAMSGRATNSSLGNNTLYFQPFDLPFYLSASRINFYVSISGALLASNSTGTCWQRASYGLYSQDSAGASTQSIRLITSYAITHLSHSMNSNTQYAATHYFGLSNATSHSTKQTALSTSNATTYLATNLNGLRVLAFPINSTLTPGRYWLAFGNATTAGNAMTNGLSVQVTSVGVQPEVRPFGQASAATNASVFRAMQGWGSYSATTDSFPSPIALSTDNIRHGVAITEIHFDILGIATSTNQI